MIERLTKTGMLPRGIMGTCCVDFDGPECDRLNGHCDLCSTNEKVWDKLCAYEDTNLTPAEITELARAKEEGRIAPTLCRNCIYHGEIPCPESDDYTADDWYCKCGIKRNYPIEVADAKILQRANKDYEKQINNDYSAHTDIYCP